MIEAQMKESDINIIGSCEVDRMVELDYKKCPLEYIAEDSQGYSLVDYIDEKSIVAF